MGYWERLERLLCPRQRGTRKWKPTQTKQFGDEKVLGLGKDPKPGPSNSWVRAWESDYTYVEDGGTVVESLNSSSNSLSWSGNDLDRDLESERKQYRARKWRSQIYRDAESIFQPLVDQHRDTPKDVHAINKRKKKWAEHNFQSILKKLDSNLSEQTMQHVYRIYVGKFRAKIDPRAQTMLSMNDKLAISS